MSRSGSGAEVKAGERESLGRLVREEGEAMAAMFSNFFLGLKLEVSVRTDWARGVPVDPL